MASAPPTENRTVIIVGGGFAGLSAAYKLRIMAPTLSYVVLEASDVLGGRAYTVGCDRDFGAGYVGQSQNHVQFLIRALQIPTERTWLAHDQQWLYHRPDGFVQAYPGDNPLAFPGVPNALFRLGELDLLTLEVRRNLREPWTLRDAPAWDSMTVQNWIDAQVAAYTPDNPEVGMSPDTERIFTASVRAAFSLEPRDLSFFFLLYYAATAGTYSSLVDIAGGDGTAEGTRFRFGTQDAIRRLEQRVGPENVRRGERVEEIRSSGGGVTVRTNRGTWQGAQAIVALSPAVSQNIVYSGLPDEGYAARQELCARMREQVGLTIKGFVRFQSPVWRQRGRMGYMLSMADITQFPVGWTLDNVWDVNAGPAEDCTESRYSLMTFIGGDAARHWSGPSITPRMRAQAVVDHLRAAYGFENTDFYTPDPADSYEELNWPGDRPGTPAPAAVMPPGVLSNARLASALRRPLGNVHWAGSETATEWCGYMNGAIESGFRCASEVLEAL